MDRHRRLAAGFRAAALTVAVILTLGARSLDAEPPGAVRVDDWDSRQAGPIDLGGPWRIYPFTARSSFKHPPAIVLDDGRPALRLSTEQEAMRVGRALKLDLRRTPWLVWEWKPLVLPERADARDRRRNDQTARIMIVFEGMKAVAYLWDTSAPVGAEVMPDELEMFQRALIVVRSGADGVGRWDRQRRNVPEDYRRAFGEEPRSMTWIGLESHSDDTRTRSAALFGAVRLEPR